MSLSLAFKAHLNATSGTVAVFDLLAIIQNPDFDAHLFPTPIRGVVCCLNTLGRIIRKLNQRCGIADKPELISYAPVYRLVYYNRGQIKHQTGFPSLQIAFLTFYQDIHQSEQLSSHFFEISLSRFYARIVICNLHHIAVIYTTHPFGDIRFKPFLLNRCDHPAFIRNEINSSCAPILL